MHVILPAISLAPDFKYLSMLKEEGGVEVVEALLQRARTPKVRELASSLITLARKPLGWL